MHLHNKDTSNIIFTTKAAISSVPFICYGLHYQQIPFEVPKNWEWCKLGDLCQINPRNKIEDELQVSFIPMTLIKDGFTNCHSSEIKKWKDVKNGFTHFRNGDIGVAKITPCFENRKSVVFCNLYNSYGAGTTELHVLRPLLSELTDYIFINIKSELFIKEGISAFCGAVGQQRISKDFVAEKMISLPPICEQNRITKLSCFIFKQIDKIAENLS